MRVFAISDLHLSFQQAADGATGFFPPPVKPMEIFGGHWKNHAALLYQNWCNIVGAEDVVLMAGDVSWGLTLADCQYDFAFLGQLPGRIILGRGNHDYWWQSEKKIAAALPPNVTPLHHRAIRLGNKTICSTRLWSCPGSNDFTTSDAKIYQRELLRLEMALAAGKALGGEQVAMLHYRPTNERLEENECIELLRSYGVTLCLYGHLHGADTSRHLPAEKWGIRFVLTSADFLRFVPLYLWEES